MTVSTFTQPNFTSQDAATYKASIDAAIAVLAREGQWFAPHAQSSPNMTVRLDAGYILNDTSPTEIAAQNSSSITAPATNPRIDRVVVDVLTGAASVVTGTEAASPVAPAIPSGKLPNCKVLLQTSSTTITNSMITDERVGTLSVISAFAQTLLDDTSASVARATLGAGTTGDAIFTAATAAAVRSTLGVSSALAFNVLDSGLVGDDSTDNTSAFNTLLTAVKNSGAAGVKRIYFPQGTYRFNSKPSSIDFGVEIFGDGMGTTILKRNYNEASTNAFLHFIAGSNSAKCRNFAIQAASGTTGGYAIGIISDASNAVSFLTFEDLDLTTAGTDTWVNTIRIDGSAKTSAPVGARDIAFRNCHVFGANGFSAIFKSVIGLSVMGGGFYAAGGTNAASGGISIEGTVSVQSQYVNINVVTVDDIQLLECDDVVVNSPVIGGNITNVSTANRVQIIGNASGTVQQNWSPGSYIPPSNVKGSSTAGGPYGYCYLPGGLIFMWGNTLVNTGGSTTVTLPVTLPNGLLNVTAVAQSTGSVAVAVDTTTFSTTQFKIANTSGTNTNVMWHAIGY